MSLPGEVVRLLPNTKEVCDKHTERKAEYRLCTETDSFGSEFEYLCYECYEAFKQFKKDVTGTCEWCKVSGIKVSPLRDAEEGSHGKVYHVCDNCRKAYNDQIAEEDEEYALDFSH